MQLITQVKIPGYGLKINHQHKLFLSGSCFVQNIYQKLSDYKFEALHNPFGTVYNPVSIAKQLNILLGNCNYSPPILVNDAWVSTDFHSSVKAKSKKEFEHTLNAIIAHTKNYITSANIFIFTFGSAWVYKDTKNNELAANCHKLPAHLFSKHLLSIDESKQAIKEIKSIIHAVNPDAKFIFTISPVRYIRDGFTENNQSKGVLHLALKETLTEVDIYFPAYEIVLDELRDYRFFDRDMVHPNALAVDYVWEKFSHAFFDEKTIVLNKTIEKLNKRLAHKPFNPESEKHQLFIKQTEAELALLPEHIRHRF
tara:strand:- start:13745 stop:14677 length:933 start_codon:yes stop_codon:yes gene_type:complete